MLILASASPRRRELLELITADFRVEARDTPETLPEGLPPKQAVQELALRKARAVAGEFPNHIVLGADTVVALGGRILGKPAGPGDAAAMLRSLSGRRHTVYTGVAICRGGENEVFCEGTRVWFRALEEGEILRYVETGEPMDKAGAYGIQGAGALFIPKIQGDYYNVMGLPVCAVSLRLAAFITSQANLLAE